MWQLSPRALAIRDANEHLAHELTRKNEERDAHPYEIDLVMFNTVVPFAHPVKHEFLLQLYTHQWPDFFEIEVDGITNHWQIRMAKALCRYKAVNFMGCASSGKSFGIAAYCYTRWKTAWDATAAYLSTTSAEAGEARSWGAVQDLWKRDQYRFGDLLTSHRIITMDDDLRAAKDDAIRDMRTGVKAVLVKTGSEGKNAVGTICGRKTENVIWNCDEMPFMEVGILDARVNLFSNPFGQFIGSGNAPEEGDPLYIDGEPFGEKYSDGWRSVDKDADEWWPTKTGICIYYNGAKSPNMKVPRGARPPFSRIMDWDKHDMIKQMAGGEDTPIFWKQFYGFPPGIDISDKVLTFKLLERNGAFGEVTWADTSFKVLAGLDLGFRADGDPCVIQFGKIGRNQTGRTVLELENDGISLVPSQKSSDAFEVQIAKRVIEECRKRDCHDLCLDVTGDGGILLQHIEREARAQNYTLNVLPVSFSGSPEDRIIIPGEKRTAKEMFDRKVTQLWVSFRLSVLNQVILGMSKQSNCTTQFCARKMGTDEKKRQTVEPKKEMKKRIRRSPDHADAAVCVHHLALRHGLSGMEVKKEPKPFNPQEFLERKGAGKYQAPPRTIYANR